jgi:TnpA family transposase
MEDNGHLRTASDAVAAAMLATPLAVHWGSGFAASADMMSLDATRRLWLARIEPRRRIPAIGTYTPISDRWAVIYDQPSILRHAWEISRAASCSCPSDVSVPASLELVERVG